MTENVSRHTISSYQDAQEAKALARQYAPQQQSSLEPEARTIGGAQSIVFGNDGSSTTNTFGVMRVNSSDLAPRDESKGIIATARSHGFGRPLSGREVTPDSIVLVQGMETTVAAAAAMKLVRVNPNTGLWQDATVPLPMNNHQDDPRGAQERLEAEYETAREAYRQAEAAAQGDDSMNDPDTIPPFSDELEGHIDEFLQAVTNTAREAGLSEMMDTGEMSAHTVANIAGQMALEFEEVQQRASDIRAAFEQQAMDVSGAGEHLSAILQTMQATDPNAVKAAVNDHVRYGKVSGYAAVVDRYIYDLPKHNPEGLLNDAGWKEHYAIRQEHNGDITIEVPGVGRVEWRAAINAKLISPTYKRK